MEEEWVWWRERGGGGKDWEERKERKQHSGCIIPENNKIEICFIKNLLIIRFP